MDIYESSHKHANDHAAATINDLKQERDRLAAENAELRKQSDEDMEAFLDMSRIADDYAAQLTTVQAELSAANATLDRLRIWIPKDMYKRGYSLEDLERCHAELYPPVDALMTALAPLFAASPWRTDAKNAPKDGSVIMGDFGCHREPLNLHIVHWDGEWWSNEDREFEYSLLRAFATINQPEIEG